MNERQTFRQNLVLAVCFVLLGYFGFHAVKGKHGLEARAGLQSRAIEFERRLARLEADRDRLDRNVDLLTDDRIDPDMLAEQARRILVMTHPNDRVVMSLDSQRR